MSHSDHEDDAYESSGEEWNSTSEDNNVSSRRTSRRLSKKPRISVVDLESSSDESDVEPPNRKSKNGTNKRQKISEEKYSDSSSPPPVEEKSEYTGQRGLHRKFIPKTIYSDNYATGSFVILKKDSQSDPSKHPSIWRIDGKALLQKYEAFDSEDAVRHKNTSVYTGWSTMDKDLYAPVTVDVITHNNQNLTVQLHWDKLKEIQYVDSE